MSKTRQVLVVLTGAGAADAGVRPGRYRVIARLPPRLMVVDAVDDLTASELRSDPAVAGVFERDASAAQFEGLRPEEQLFVDGWLLGSTQETKPRVGDGLSWDAPGFQPPDLPPKTRE